MSQNIFPDMKLSLYKQLKYHNGCKSERKVNCKLKLMCKVKSSHHLCLSYVCHMRCVVLFIPSLPIVICYQGTGSNVQWILNHIHISVQHMQVI